MCFKLTLKNNTKYWVPIINIVSYEIIERFSRLTGSVNILNIPKKRDRFQERFYTTSTMTSSRNTMRDRKIALVSVSWFTRLSRRLLWKDGSRIGSNKIFSDTYIVNLEIHRNAILELTSKVTQIYSKQVLIRVTIFIEKWLLISVISLNKWWLNHQKIACWQWARSTNCKESGHDSCDLLFLGISFQRFMLWHCNFISHGAIILIYFCLLFLSSSSLHFVLQLLFVLTLSAWYATIASAWHVARAMPTICPFHTIILSPTFQWCYCMLTCTCCH